MARSSTAAKHGAENGAARSKRQSILDAATRVFLDCGYGDASMDAVAREAGELRAILRTNCRQPTS